MKKLILMSAAAALFIIGAVQAQTDSTMKTRNQKNVRQTNPTTGDSSYNKKKYKNKSDNKFKTDTMTTQVK